MKAAKELISGWAVFGIGDGLSYRGQGSLAFSERDWMMGVFDSQPARQEFWRSCLSVHGCGDASVIFTVRESVRDSAGRAGYCAVAVAVRSGALQASDRACAWLLKGARSLLRDLRKEGVSREWDRFVFLHRDLERFIADRPHAFGLKRLSGAQGAAELSRASNTQRASYWMETGVFRRVEAGRFLALHLAGMPASLYLFEAAKAPRDADIGHLTEGGLAELHAGARTRLAAIAESRRVEGERRSLLSALGQARGLAAVEEEASPLASPSKEAEQKEAGRAEEASARDQAHEAPDRLALSHELAAIKVDLDGLWDQLQGIHRHVIGLDQRLAQWGAESPFPTPEKARAIAGAGVPKRQGLRSPAISFDAGRISAVALGVGAVAFLFYGLVALSIAGKEAAEKPGGPISSCHAAQVPDAVKSAILKLLPANGGLTAGEAANLERALECCAETGAKIGGDCRLVGRAEMAAKALKAARVQGSASSREGLETGLLDLMAELASDACRAR